MVVPLVRDEPVSYVAVSALLVCGGDVPDSVKVSHEDYCILGILVEYIGCLA